MTVQTLRADQKAKEMTYVGPRMADTEIVTPAGIKALGKALRSRKRSQLKWSNQAIRGLTYLYTGRGPMKAWLFKIGKAENPDCGCGMIQDVEHIHGGCGELKACSREDMWQDEKWCEEVFFFLRGG